MTPIRLKRLAAFAVVAVFASSCGGGSDEEPGLATLETEPTTETTVSTTSAVPDVQLDAEEALLAFASCMRDEGIDFPDPFVDAGGNVQFGFEGNQPEDLGFDPFSDEFGAAFEDCEQHLEGAALGPGGREFDETEMQDLLLAMAQCMRDQGLEVDDPDLSMFQPGNEGGRIPFSELDLSDPDVLEAIDVCRRELALDGLGFGGPGAEGNGG